MNLEIADYKLHGLKTINVIMGKNGCGKSTLLKTVERALRGQTDKPGTIRYITPERGGNLSYEPSIEQSMANDLQWMLNTRSVNQFGQFRQQTVAQYRNLRTSVLEEVEDSYQDGTAGTRVFAYYIDQINGLLDNIELRVEKSKPIFTVYKKGTEVPIASTEVSSGEAELVSLAIECLAFTQTLVYEGRNILFFDEPDVHLHPDLQARFMKFVKTLVKENDFLVIIATHSTPILSEIADYAGATVSLMKAGDRELSFEPIDDAYKAVLPIFGAHPLSNVFNDMPILLLEGEDDVRIWQQAVRSSGGSIRVYPVECGTITLMHEYEQRVAKISAAIYDNATAFSLRDRDESSEEINDDPPVIRMKLSCRSAENLILSDEVIHSAGTTWEDVKANIDKWVTSFEGHSKHEVMKQFADGGYERRGSDLKQLRSILVADMLGSSKPWEVLVGQIIGTRALGSGEGSLADYLGDKTVSSLSLM